MKHTGSVSVTGILISWMMLFSAIAPIEAQSGNFVMVSLGDSFAAGKGFPNAPTTSFSPATWNNNDCFRSANAPALLAFKSLASQHSSVPFVRDGSTIPHFACSGAKIPDVIQRAQRDSVTQRMLQPDSQIQILKDWMMRSSPHASKIDALIIAIGVNDLEFEQAVRNCLISARGADCSQQFIGGFTNPYWNGDASGGNLKSDLGILRSGLDSLVDTINGLKDPQTGSAIVKNVFLVEYPDPTQDAFGRPCNTSPTPDFANWTSNESAWAAGTAVKELNNALDKAVTRGNTDRLGVTRWYKITGIASRFAKHGFCSDALYVRGLPVQRYINSVGDSLSFESAPSCNVLGAVVQCASGGAVQLGCECDATMHPNLNGARATGEAISAFIEPLLAAPPAPTNLTASATPASIDLSWDDGGSVAGNVYTPVEGNTDTYEVAYITSQTQAWTSLPSISWNTPRQARLPNPVPGLGYKFIVSACNRSLGAPVCSNYTAVVVGPYVPYQPIPATPTNLRLTTILGIGPTLQWNDNSSNEDRFEIQGRSVTGAWESIATARPNSSSFSLVSDVFDLTGYAGYRVRACAVSVCSAWNTTP